MKKNINILSLTSADFKKGKYKSLLPEYYALESLTENNAWHANQNALGHLIAVFKGLEEILKLDFLKKESREQIEKYLDSKIGNYSKKELLIVAAIFHDIAKSETLIRSESGVTRCPGHEIIGSHLVGKFTDRLGLDEKAKERVAKIIRYHGFISEILDLVINKNNEQKYFSILKAIVDDIHVELLLFMYADMMGSDLKQNIPQEYKTREKLIIKFLES